ncbi:MAG: hypothetical protein WCK26_00020 [Candidatus Saccharibacteria bacterium]
MENEHRKGKKKSYHKVVLLIIVSLVVIFCVAGMIFFYNKYQDLKNNPELVAKQQNELVVNEIGQLMVLPNGEEPTVATVTDSTKLSSQTFFKDSKNGDKVVAYTVAKKVILYRPSVKKIINIAPFTIDTGSIEDSQNK